MSWCIDLLAHLVGLTLFTSLVVVIASSSATELGVEGRTDRSATLDKRNAVGADFARVPHAGRDRAPVTRTTFVAFFSGTAASPDTNLEDEGDEALNDEVGVVIVVTVSGEGGVSVQEISNLRWQWYGLLVRECCSRLLTYGPSSLVEVRV